MKKIFILFSFITGYWTFVFFLQSVNKDYNIVISKGEGIYAINNQINTKTNLFIDKFTSFLFAKYINIHDKNIKFGEYQIQRKDNLMTIYKKILNGDTINYSLTIPEGTTLFDTISIINNESKLTGELIEFNIQDEGLLMPDTYLFDLYTNRQKLYDKMKKDMQIFLENAWLKRDKNIPIIDSYQALILASIVEKESANEEEKPIIASVFYNRLQKKMRLQSDPTFVYQITKGKYKLGTKFTKAQINQRGDYNTYTIKGLPIAPICNPSKTSIIATLNPAKTNYLYFVVSYEDNKKHLFSVDYKQHMRNINMYKKSLKK